jgi:hypothetical protein
VVSKDSRRIPAILFAIVLVWCKRFMLVSPFLESVSVRSRPDMRNGMRQGAITLEKLDGAFVRSATRSGTYGPGYRLSPHTVSLKRGKTIQGDPVPSALFHWHANNMEPMLGALELGAAALRRRTCITGRRSSRWETGCSGLCGSHTDEGTRVPNSAKVIGVANDKVPDFVGDSQLFLCRLPQDVNQLLQLGTK